MLRDHPLMSYCGLPSWPPIWTWIDELENSAHMGIGILGSNIAHILHVDRRFVYVDHGGLVVRGCSCMMDDEGRTRSHTKEHAEIFAADGLSGSEVHLATGILS